VCFSRHTPHRHSFSRHMFSPMPTGSPGGSPLQVAGTTPPSTSNSNALPVLTESTSAAVVDSTPFEPNRLLPIYSTTTPRPQFGDMTSANYEHTSMMQMLLAHQQGIMETFTGQLVNRMDAMQARQGVLETITGQLVNRMDVMQAQMINRMDSMQQHFTDQMNQQCRVLMDHIEKVNRERERTRTKRPRSPVSPAPNMSLGSPGMNSTDLLSLSAANRRLSSQIPRVGWPPLSANTLPGESLT